MGKGKEFPAEINNKEVKRMKTALAVLVSLLVTGSYVWAQSRPGPTAPPMGAQPAPSTQGTNPSDTRTSQEKQVEGNITSMDASGKSITLDDGTRLMIPDSLRVARGALKEGARVKATYKEQAGQKVATSITVQSKS